MGLSRNAVYPEMNIWTFEWREHDDEPLDTPGFWGVPMIFRELCSIFRPSLVLNMSHLMTISTGNTIVLWQRCRTRGFLVADGFHAAVLIKRFAQQRQRRCLPGNFTIWYPICSTYGICINTYLQNRPNVGKYTSTMEHLGFFLIPTWSIPKQPTHWVVTINPKEYTELTSWEGSYRAKEAWTMG